MKTSSEVGGKSISQGFNVKSTKATTFFKKQSPADNKEINGVDGSRVSIEAESQQGKTKSLSQENISEKVPEVMDSPSEDQDSDMGISKQASRPVSTNETPVIKDVFNRANHYSFRKHEQKGKGHFASVIRVRDKFTDKFYAAKEKKEDESTKREVEVMTQLSKHNNPRITNLVSIEKHEGVDYIVMEMGGESLQSRMQRQDPLLKEHQLKVIDQLLDGAEFISDTGYIHQDLRVDNLLLDDEGNLKICDFGVTQPKEGHITTKVPITHMPPDFMDGSRSPNTLDTVDSWGIGCTMAEVITGELLIPPVIQRVIYNGGDFTISDYRKLLVNIDRQMGEDADFAKAKFQEIVGFNQESPLTPDQLDDKLLSWRNTMIEHRVKNAALKVNKELGSEAAELFKGLLAINPEERLTPKKANEHPFLLTIRRQDSASQAGGNKAEPVVDVNKPENNVESVSQPVYMNLSFEGSLTGRSKSSTSAMGSVTMKPPM